MTNAIIVEWASMIFRWLHAVAAIGWIGSSFYFIHLDLSLKEREQLPEGAYGNAWQVHGGGFYNIVKYLVAPKRMPEELTWFYWEAYATWLSGFCLVILVYYWDAEFFLIDKSVMDLSPFAAAGFSLVSLALAWLLYEAACRTAFAARNELAFALTGYAFLVALTYAFTHMLSGRGAFNQIGAIIGTIMVANVFLIVIPNQRKTVAALIAGKEPDPEYGRQGKQRSVHNNYLTLPVVLLMISNHYPLLYATKYNWLIVAIVLALGPIIRHFYNSRHAGLGSPWWTWGVAAAGMIAIAFLSAAGPRDAKTAQSAAPTFRAVQNIVSSRCSPCHASDPVWADIATAPRGVILDDADHILRNAQLIGRIAVWSNAMPPGNITEMTPDERATLAAWLDAGTPGN